MERTITVCGRGVFCAFLLTGLAACNGDGSSSDAPGTPPSSNTPTAPGNSVNAAPSINGNPRTEIQVGNSYSFTPIATDSDGDGLTFTVSSLPPWASFSSSSGRLFGTPAADDVGSYEEIVISVSDGTASRALAEFSINVVQQGSASVTLAWTAPMENTDGSALVNLSGYKIHYGTEPGQYDEVVSVNNSGLTRYVIDDLSPGTYFFAISAVANGVESELSGEASKTI